VNSKRQVLLAICDTPGWHPPESSASADRFLEELEREGWVISRLDGYEATPKALDAYPRFDEQGDIADPEPIVASAFSITKGGVSLERVELLVACMLCELPLSRVIGMLEATREQVPDDPRIWTNATGLAAHFLQED
jgi:hypothetical protein